MFFPILPRRKERRGVILGILYYKVGAPRTLLLGVMPPLKNLP
ncbi:hypothetical protein A2U01_0118741, partial [Trifolium medium]|nr:hypothetical protein [Trifolium medium]